MKVLRKLCRISFCLISLVIIAMGFSVTCDSKELISRRIEKAGKTYDVGETLIKPDPVRLSLVEGCTDGGWSWYYLHKDGSYVWIDKNIISGSKSCVIEPPGSRDLRNAKCEFCEELDRDVFSFRVNFSTVNAQKDTVYLKWALLPSRPIIEDVKFTYVFDWIDNDIYPNGDFSFRVKSEDAERYWLHVSYPGLFSPPEIPYWCMEFDLSESDVMQYKADWGEYVSVETVNHFGSVLSDMICTTSYIYDADVLERIRSLQDSGTERVSAPDDDPLYSWGMNTIRFNRIVDILYLYDVAGNQLRCVENIDTFSFDDLDQGFLILVYQSNSQIFKRKIIKK